MKSLNDLCFSYGLEPYRVTIKVKNSNETYENCLIWNEFNRIDDTDAYISYAYYNNNTYNIVVSKTELDKYLFNKDSVLTVDDFYIIKGSSKLEDC